MSPCTPCLQVVRYALKVSAAVEADSVVVGKLAAGARVSVLDRNVLLDGTLRWRMGKVQHSTLTTSPHY